MEKSAVQNNSVKNDPFFKKLWLKSTVAKRGSSSFCVEKDNAIDKPGENDE